MTRADTVASATLRALLAPRRAIPLLLVGSTLLVSEWFTTRSWPAVGVDLGLFLAFCAIAPGAWRWLCAGESRGVRALATHAAYVVVVALTVGLLGLALPPVFGSAWTYVVEPSSFGMLLVLFLVGGWGLGRDIELERGYTSERRRAERMALEAERAQVLALRAQLDPHFLFNTLNAIAEWCRENPAVAEAATLQLASTMRMVLDGIQRPTWPLARELDLLRSLMKLYQVRDSDRYVLEEHIPDPVPDLPVAPMLLLPLLENAITHGPAAGHGGAVKLRVVEHRHVVLVEIVNPGRFGGRRAGGQGIAIVERRLSLTYGSDAVLRIAGEGDCTVARVELPRGAERQGSA